jgi:acyl carrier protein
MDSVLEQLQPIFRDVLDQDDLVITRESNAGNVKDWDSLAHVNLVTAVEKRFKVRFALGELQSMKNVGDMVDLIHAKQAAR